jgi:hypothetical protein
LPVVAALACAGELGAGGEKESGVSQRDAAEIRRVAAGMIEAWYGGDAEKMAGVLDDNLAKRGVITDPKTGVSSFLFADKKKMVEGARRGGGGVPQAEWDIQVQILDQAERMATVKVVSAYLIDVCQLAKLGDRWQIVNVLWTTRGAPPWMK